eukprot:13905500-Ditylum_brightwellii.AAC.1
MRYAYNGRRITTHVAGNVVRGVVGGGSVVGGSVDVNDVFHGGGGGVFCGGGGVFSGVSGSGGVYSSCFVDCGVVVGG